jgi:hypothetical protein
MRLLLPGRRVSFYGQTIMQPEVEVLTDHNELICSTFIEPLPSDYEECCTTKPAAKDVFERSPQAFLVTERLIFVDRIYLHQLLH